MLSDAQLDPAGQSRRFVVSGTQSGGSWEMEGSTTAPGCTARIAVGSDGIPGWWYRARSSWSIARHPSPAPADKPLLPRLRQPLLQLFQALVQQTHPRHRGILALQCQQPRCIDIRRFEDFRAVERLRPAHDAADFRAPARTLSRSSALRRSSPAWPSPQRPACFPPGRAPSTAPRGLCFHPSAYCPPLGCNVEVRSRYTLNCDVPPSPKRRAHNRIRSEPEAPSA